MRACLIYISLVKYGLIREDKYKGKIEYFQNDTIYNAAFNFFTDKDVMIHKIKTSKLKFLSLNNRW